MEVTVAPKEKAKTNSNRYGDRLNRLLDRIDFPKSGRIKKFHELLKEDRKFDDLGYPTVKSWFTDTLPRSHTIESIVKIIAKAYDVNVPSYEIEAYWSVGSYPNPIPFKYEICHDSHYTRKLSSLIELLFQESQVGSKTSLDQKRETLIKKRTLDYMLDFENPYKRKSRSDIIRHFLEAAKKDFS